MEAIKDAEKKDPDDKLRLLIVFYLSMPDGAIPKEDIVEYERALKEAGAEISAWQYVKKWVAPVALAAERQKLIDSCAAIPQNPRDHENGYVLSHPRRTAVAACRSRRRDVQRTELYQQQGELANSRKQPLFAECS